MHLPVARSVLPAAAAPASLVLLIAPLVSACVQSVPLAIAINEFQPSNVSGLKNEMNSRVDWIELFNNTDQDVALGGWYLTDDLKNPLKAPLSADIVVPSQGYLVLWADKEEKKGPYHLPFSLRASGEEIGLFAGEADDVVRKDWIVFGAIADDWSLARQTDGDADWELCDEPTPGASNDGSAQGGR